MTKKTVEVLKKIYKLSLERRLEYENRYNKERVAGEHSEDILEITRNPNENSAKYKLYNYLNELDFETIKIIQTIMYLGRDNEYKNLHNGEQRYLKLRTYFDSRGWNTKSIEINQIIEKIPLDKYLKKGSLILGIIL